MQKQKTWVEISKNNLLHNINQFRARVGSGVKIAAVVKSNAYGHGLVEVARAVEESVDFLAVDSVDEAWAIASQKSKVLSPKSESQGASPESKVKSQKSSSRENAIQKSRPQIIILGYTLLENLEQVVDNGWHQVVANFETLEKFDEICKKKNKPVLVHLKIETGTSRQGIWPKDLPRFFELIKSNPQIKLAGMSTHFANVEDTTDHSYAQSQLAIFRDAVKAAEAAGFNDFIKHTACSAAALVFPKTHFDMIRLGISLYGLWSSDATKVSAKQIGLTDFVLKPCLTWKTRVAQIKDLPAGASVGYGCSEKVNVNTKVAILPVGYWDGYGRGLSSVGKVLIHSQRCRVIGRVCMNMMIVDVSHVENAQLEDEVVLLGRQGNEEITAEELARKLNTINYEVVTRINPQIKRILI